MEVSRGCESIIVAAACCLVLMCSVLRGVKGEGAGVSMETKWAVTSPGLKLRVFPVLSGCWRLCYAVPPEQKCSWVRFSFAVNQSDTLVKSHSKSIGLQLHLLCGTPRSRRKVAYTAALKWGMGMHTE
ncbi:hypothetical protein SKAU_G00261050 [Synaphobranchus kaupii]|uniref:Secreted protein n=1 Tax=Synaphobranchus kaupii TaxID=118154 RepID=A0A9Q1EYK8_SYNKA|nr:hypothetical protein SKAU_G00261050 [Synaphobranchus kaupii]